MADVVVCAMVWVIAVVMVIAEGDIEIFDPRMGSVFITELAKAVEGMRRTSALKPNAASSRSGEFAFISLGYCPCRLMSMYARHAVMNLNSSSHFQTQQLANARSAKAQYVKFFPMSGSSLKAQGFIRMIPGQLQQRRHHLRRNRKHQLRLLINYPWCGGLSPAIS